MTDSVIQRELQDLLAQLGDTGLNAQQLNRLDEILRVDANVRRHYREYVEVHVLLEWMHSPQLGLVPRVAIEQSGLESRDVERGLRRVVRKLVRFFSRPTPLSMTIAALVVGVLISALAYTTVPLYQRWIVDPSVPSAPVFVAELSDVRDAVWAEGQIGVRPRAQLVAGHHMELRKGLAEVTFRSGAKVVLEGPAVLTLNDRGLATLETGRLTARVPEAARGFAIETEQASIIDLGTEFAVEVSQRHPVTVAVFEGSVTVRSKHPDSTSQRQRLIAGETVRLTDALVWSNVPTQQRGRFVRELPRATAVAELNHAGNLSDGFPTFLNADMVNATTRAWNLNGSKQTLNGVVLESASASVQGLEIVGDPGVYASQFLNWQGDPQASAKNEISNTGLVTIAPRSWGMKIAATAGKRYRVQLLSNSVVNIPVRRFHVLLDRQRLAEELVVPAAEPWAVVYTFELIADTDGIDLHFVPSAKDHTNPYVTAAAVSEVADPSP